MRGTMLRSKPSSAGKNGPSVRSISTKIFTSRLSIYGSLVARFCRRSNQRLGYSTIVAVYRDFDEIYYMPQAECIWVAEDLVEAVRSSLSWLQAILDEICERAVALKNVFRSPFPVRVWVFAL